MSSFIRNCLTFLNGHYIVSSYQPRWRVWVLCFFADISLDQSVWPSWRTCSVTCLQFLKIYIFYLFIHESHTERRREKQPSCREPDVGLDPRTPGPRPEPKVDRCSTTEPPRHPRGWSFGEFSSVLPKCGNNATFSAVHISWPIKSVLKWSRRLGVGHC